MEESIAYFASLDIFLLVTVQALSMIHAFVELAIVCYVVLLKHNSITTEYLVVRISEIAERYSISRKEETLEWIRIPLLIVAIELYSTIVLEIQLSFVKS